MLTRLTIDEVQEHIDECTDGVECKFRTAQAWAEGVAAPDHVSEVRDLMMALHLSEMNARDHHGSVQMFTTLIAALVRRTPTKAISIEKEEIIDRIERLVVEQRDDDGVDLTLVQKPDGDHSLS